MAKKKAKKARSELRHRIANAKARITDLTCDLNKLAGDACELEEIVNRLLEDLEDKLVADDIDTDEEAAAFDDDVPF